MSGWMAEKNARLLIDLLKTHGANDIGSIAGFFETNVDWQCPCCLRTKEEIARLDRNGDLLCAIHNHHDHFCEYAYGRYPAGIRPPNIVRFNDVMICNDCNVADPAAKVSVQAPEFFSFAPFEIAGFIKVSPNKPHGIDHDMAEKIYAAARPSMRLLSERVLRDAKLRQEG